MALAELETIEQIEQLNNRNDPVRPRQRFLFTPDEVVNIQSDNPTSPESVAQTLLTNELLDSIVIFTNKMLIL